MGKTKTINKSKRCSKSQPSLPQASLTSPLHNKILLLEEIYQQTKSLMRSNSVLITTVMMKMVLENANEWLSYTVLIILQTKSVRKLLQHSSRAIMIELHEQSAYSSQSNLTTARL